MKRLPRKVKKLTSINKNPDGWMRITRRTVRFWLRYWRWMSKNVSPGTVRVYGITSEP